MTFLQRVAFECGHSMIWGPWDHADDLKMIGEITVCEICPLVLTGRVSESALRQIVDVAKIEPKDYRTPVEHVSRRRTEQLYDYR